MRKTKLMEITEKYEGRETLIANTRYIDSIAYMLCDMAEGEFGPDFIEAIEEFLIYTQVGADRTDSLYFLVNNFIHDGLINILAQNGYGNFAKDLGQLTKFSEETHMDYFTAFMQLEKEVRGSKLEKACQNLQKLLFGVTSNTIFTVCQGIVTFYKEIQDQYGLFLLVKKYCQYLKAKADTEDE